MSDTSRLLLCVRENDPGSELKLLKAATGSSTSSKAPYNYRGNGIALRVGIFSDKETPEDLSNIASLTLKYQDGFAAVSAEAEVTVAAAAFEATTITKAGFEAGTEWHAEFQFEDADMNPSLASQEKKEFRMILKGQTDAGREITFGTAVFTLYEDDSDTVGDPSGGGTAITSAQAVALIEAAVGKVYEFTIASGQPTVAVSFSPALGSTPTHAGVSGYQATDETPVGVAIDPASLSASGCTVKADSTRHSGIKGIVIVRV